MATRFRLNFEQIFGTSAQVLAGGTLTFAISGGAPDQLRAIYQDPALAVTKLNPVVLDSAGKHGDIWLDDPSLYRVILKDAAGIVIPGGDVDPIGGGVGKDTNAGLLNVKAFGAKGDGATDDWAALNAAWLYAISHGQSGLFVPVGNYMLSQPLNINNASLIGASEVGTVFRPLASFSGDAILYLDDSRAGAGGNARYTNFRILGDRTTVPAAAAGLKLIGNVLYNTFMNIRINETKGAGILIDGKTGPVVRPTLCNFINCQIDGGDGDGLLVKAGRHMHFDQCAFENLTGTGINVTSATEQCSKLVFTTPYLENILTDGIVLTSCDQSRVISPLINGYGKTSTPSFGYRNTGSACSLNKLYGGNFNKNASPNAASRDVLVDGGDRTVLENMGTSNIVISGNRGVIISGMTSDQQSLVPIHFTNAQNLVNTTVYLGPNMATQSTTEANISGVAAGYMSLSQLRFIVGTSPGAGAYTASLFVNGAAFGLSATISGSATSASDLTGSAMLNPGDTYSVQVSVSATANAIAQNNGRISIGARHN